MLSRVRNASESYWRGMIRRILSVLCGTTHLSLILECAVGSDADILGSDLGAVPYEKR